MKHFTSKTLLVALFALIGLSATATATTTTIKVGIVANGSDYSTIQAAYNSGIPADISTAGAYIIQLQSDYDPTGETYPITLGYKTGASATNSITITPATGVTRTLSCANQTVSLPGCVINSATSITVPSAAGLSVGMYISNIKYTTPITGISGNTLTVATQSTTSGTYDMVAGPATGTTTIYLNGAQYVTIDGVARSGATQLIIDNPNRIASQSILFKNDASYNTVKYCTVKGVSQTSIAAVTGSVSDNGTIFIYNTTSTTADKGNDNNVIDNCDIVDGTSIPVTHVFISGTTTATNDNNKITNCNIDNACLTVSGSNSPGYVVVGISSLATNTEISNNRMYASKSLSPSANLAYSLIITSGLNTTVSSNTLGSSAKDGTGLFTIPGTAVGATMAGINIKSGTATVSGNTVANFDVFCMSISGIWLASSSAGTVYSNTINNIKSSTTFNTVALSGIYAQTSGIWTISDNTISNLTNLNTTSSNFAMTKGLFIGTASSSTFTHNTIFNLTAGNTTSTGANLSIGIDATKNITTIDRNLIYNVNAISTAATNTQLAMGIRLNAGIDAGFTIKNNMIRLGSDVTTNANIYGIYQIAATASTNKFYIYHNSIYIGGTAPATSPVSSYAYNRTTGTAGIIDLRNNILSNQRVQGVSENHYAVALLLAADLATSNNNIYQYRGNLGVIAGTNKADLAAWQGALYISPANNDANSLVTDPLFIDALGTTANLHISSSSPAYGTAFDLGATVLNDFDGKLRADYNHKDIGADVYGFYTAIPKAEVLVAYNIYASGNGIFINNATGQTASIYSTVGQLMKSVQITSDNVFLALPRGFYAVALKDVRTKVLVK